MGDVFVSYHHEDLDVAMEACKALENAGMKCWIAPRDEYAGEQYEDSIDRGLSEAKIVVFIGSTNSNTSKGCRKELLSAEEYYSLPIIPFWIDDTEPARGLKLRLAGVQRIDALTRPIDYSRLVRDARHFVEAANFRSDQPEESKRQTPAETAAVDEQSKIIEAIDILEKVLQDPITLNDPKVQAFFSKWNQHTGEAPEKTAQVAVNEQTENQVEEKQSQSGLAQVKQIYEQLDEQAKKLVDSEQLSDAQKEQLKRWQILQDTQKKIFQIQQDVTTNKAKSQQKAFSKWDEYIRS